MAAGNEQSERRHLLHSPSVSSDYSQSHGINMTTAISNTRSFYKPLCPFQDLSVETNSVEILQAAVFVEDAINYRSIHHKIDPMTLNMFYRPYYRRIVQWSINFFIAVYLLLAFFEKPSSLHLNSDYRNRSKKADVDPPCGVTESIEFLCLFIFTFDVLVQFKLIGWRRYIRRPWLVLYTVLIIVSGIDLLVSLGSVCKYVIRVRRLLRPIFLLQRSSIMKKMVNAIKKSLPQILSVLVLLLLILYVFAMLGLLLFHRGPTHKPANSNDSSNSTNTTTDVLLDETDNSLQNYTGEELEGHLYFSSFREAFVSLLVLLTTANNPDSMLPAYTQNRFYAIYFIVFVGLCTYIILNLLTAVIYNQFRGYLRKSVQSSFFRRRVGLRAAFIVLCIRKRDPRNGLEVEIIHKDTIKTLLHNVHMKKKYLPQMFNMLETMNTDYFSWVQFRSLFDILGKKPSKQLTNDEPISNIRWFARFQLVVRHKYFMYFTHVVSVIHAAFITVMLIYNYDQNFAHHDSALMIGNFFFIIYYLLELVIKILGLSVKGYLKKFGNIYEGLVTLLLVALMITYIVKFGSPIHGSLRHLATEENERIDHLNSLIRVITICVILRLLRVVPHIQRLYVVVATVIDLISHLRGFMGIIVAVYYFFAILGMQLFAKNYTLEQISPSQCTDHLLDAKKCTQYQQLNYYANNFHDFSAALVVLWDVMVVNNWYIFLNGYLWMTGTAWAQLYFIAWWLVSVIVCVNLFVALVLEAFISRWERVQHQESAELYNSTFMNSVVYDSHNYQQSDVQALLQEHLEEPHDADIMLELQKHHDMILATNY